MDKAIRNGLDTENLQTHTGKSYSASATLWIVCILICVNVRPDFLFGQDVATEHFYFSKTAYEPVAHWSYDGSTGPAFWAELDRSYRLAKTGKRQSPIDIDSKATIKTALPPLRFDYQPERIAAINNGHTIQHDETSQSFLTLGTDKFGLKQYHVHTPSEHTLDGKHFEMEIHFVHKSDAGKVAVVALLVEASEKSTLDFPVYRLPEGDGQGVAYRGTRNAKDFLPTSLDYFSYPGSFTMPPCSEDVLWIVLKHPVAIHPGVIQRFRAILKANNRPVQSLNDRVIRQSR